MTIKRNRSTPSTQGNQPLSGGESQPRKADEVNFPLLYQNFGKTVPKDFNERSDKPYKVTKHHYLLHDFEIVQVLHFGTEPWLHEGVAIWMWRRRDAKSGWTYPTGYASFGYAVKIVNALDVME